MDHGQTLGRDQITGSGERVLRGWQILQFHHSFQPGGRNADNRLCPEGVYDAKRKEIDRCHRHETVQPPNDAASLAKSLSDPKNMGCFTTFFLPCRESGLANEAASGRARKAECLRYEIFGEIQIQIHRCGATIQDFTPSGFAESVFAMDVVHKSAHSHRKHRS